MAYSDTLTYDTAASLSFDTSLVQISAGALTLKSPYSLLNPKVTSQRRNTISSLASFAESSTLPANTSITYQLVLGSSPYYYNATNSTWAASDGTFAQSNTAAVISTNKATLFSQLAILSNQFLGLNIFLNTTNASNAPILATNTIGYTWTNANATGINQCTVTATLANLVGTVPLPTALTPAQLLVSCSRGFFHGNNFIEPFTRAFSFDTGTGALTASIIETTTPGVPLQFSLTYWDGQSIRTSFLFNAQVPNQSQIALANLSSVVPYDFG